MIKFFKDGDTFGICTDIKKSEALTDPENEFMYEVSEKISRLIDREYFKGDWQFQLNGYLPIIVDICSYYRGNPNGVELNGEYLNSGGFNISFVEELYKRDTEVGS